MADVDLVFEKKFKISVVAMHLNGSYPSIARTKLWLIRSSFVFLTNVFSFYLLSYSVLFHDIRTGNFIDACRNISMVVICMNTSIKYLVLLHYRESITHLINVVNDDYDIAKRLSLGDQLVVKRYSRMGYLVCVFWSACVSSASSIFIIRAVALTVYSYWVRENELVPIFDVTFPTVIEKVRDSLSLYCSIFALCLSFAFFTTLMYIGFDTLIPIFTLHTCGQLDLLSRRISIALSETATLEKKEENLKMIIIKLQKLYRYLLMCPMGYGKTAELLLRITRFCFYFYSFINVVQTTFTVVNEQNMKTTTILVPLLLFGIVEDLRNNVISYEYFMLLVGSTLHFFIPCYFSDLLMERSAEFRQAIYSCGWEKHPDKSIRQTVLFMLTRASRPLGLYTVFSSISMDTFATMIRQSYSLFNLMNAAWGK